MSPTKRYLTTEEAAEYLGLAPATLEKKRCTGSGPPFIKPPGSRRVFYAREDLDAWMAAGRRTSTSEQSAAEQPTA